MVFALHNFGYPHRTAFEGVDYVTVPSEFSRRSLLRQAGPGIHVLPNVVACQAADVPREQRPLPHLRQSAEIKGLYVFARIARELARRRPDIVDLGGARPQQPGRHPQPARAGPRRAHPRPAAGDS